MDFVLDLPQASSGEGFQISFEQMAFLGPNPKKGDVFLPCLPGCEESLCEGYVSMSLSDEVRECSFRHAKCDAHTRTLRGRRR